MHGPKLPTQSWSWKLIFGHFVVLTSTSIPQNMSFQLQFWVESFGQFGPCTFGRGLPILPQATVLSNNFTVPICSNLSAALSAKRSHYPMHERNSNDLLGLARNGQASTTMRCRKESSTVCTISCRDSCKTSAKHS